MTAAVMLVLTVGGLLGLAIGSFLNVVVYRVPNGLSVVSPPSACPGCQHPIRARDNIPGLSWFVLRGRCRDCAEPISFRYPAVELATGAFFVAVLVVFGGQVLTAPTPLAVASDAFRLLALLYLAGITVALALIDIDVHRLPNTIVLPSYLVAFVLLGASAAFAGDGEGALRAAIGAAAMFVFYFVLAFAVPGGMGFGDVKLAGVLGLYLGSMGWEQLVVGAFAAFLLGGLAGIALRVSGRVARRGGIPFGPWMLAGAWVGIFVGPVIGNGYLRLVGFG